MSMPDGASTMPCQQHSPHKLSLGAFKVHVLAFRSEAKKGTSGSSVERRHASRGISDSRTPRISAISSPLSSSPLRDLVNEIASRNPN
jgi:hypothetical protein